MPEASARRLQADPKPAVGSWLAYRQTDLDPRLRVFWAAGSQRRPIGQPSARWHLQGQGFAQYLALSADGAWAEWLRNAELLTDDAARQTRRRLWSACIHDSNIADLSTPEARQGTGIGSADLIGTHESCREIAAELVRGGYRGILAPSASLVGETNLTLFGPRAEVLLGAMDQFAKYTVDPDVIEVKLLRAGSAPPDGLAARVLHH